MSPIIRRKTGAALLEDAIRAQRRMVNDHRANVAAWEARSTREGEIVPNAQLAAAREDLAGEEAYLARLVARREEA